MNTTQKINWKPFSLKHREYIHRAMRSKMSVAEGAIRSGKTIDHCIIAAALLEKSRDKIHLASGSTIANAKMNIGDCNGFGLEHLFRGRCRWGKYKDNEALFIQTQTGEKVLVFAGGGKADSYRKILGNSYGLWIATEINEHYDSDDSRTSFIKVAMGRQAAALDPHILWDMNPCQPMHPIYTDYIDVFPEKFVGGYNYQHFTMADNLSITPQRRAEIASTYDVDSVWYKRDILGERCIAEGLIYPNYENALQAVQAGEPDDYVLSVDYGTLNAFAGLLWAKYGDVWYCVDEYYYSGRDKGVQKTDQDYAQDLEAFIEPVKAWHAKRVARGLEYGGLELTTIIDPSAASFIALLRKDYDCFRVRKAKNDVVDGIRETAVAMKTGAIKIAPTLKNLITELQGYVWDDKAQDEAPLKVNDHACITGDSLMMTEHGNVPIRELVGKTGKVWSLNTETGAPELKVYRDVRCTKKKAKIFKITLNDGKTIRCTEDHPVLTERGYVPVKYLLKTDRIIEITPKM